MLTVMIRFLPWLSDRFNSTYGSLPGLSRRHLPRAKKRHYAA